uniref:Uncharacterized protein n=1 Tax=Maylandia zebra TaxID=106582 RepID=A0A3P9B0M0_9CICH
LWCSQGKRPVTSRLQPRSRLLLALCEMSGKYQEHQFPLTVILPQRAASHKSGDEAHAANRAGNSWRADITAICFPALREERLLSRDITHRAASDERASVCVMSSKWL